LKGLQYMAMEIPTMMSPVGVNKEIIQDGVNGYLANDTNEWVNKISFLIENPAMRVTVGKNGRQTVVEKYSVISQRQRYLNQLVSLLK
jgi:glycosyltransferase involved in cell wall biosynthesis